MLEAIRQYSSSLVVKLLFVVLILSFVIWGVADVLRPRSDRQWAAEVGDATISSRAFSSEYQEQVRRLGTSLGSPVDAEQARAMGLPKTVLDRLINNALLDLSASEMGLTVSDDVVRSLITSDRRFFGTSGQFDPATFRRTLQAAGYTEEGFIELLRADVSRSLMLSSITAGLAPPKALLEMTERRLLEERSGSYVTLALAGVKDVGQPDDAALRQYYTDNPGLFTAPEYRAVTAIVLDAGELAKTIDVTEENLKAAYEERIDEFTVPERRSLQQMAYPDEAAAAAARLRLREGADFAAVAAETLGLKVTDLAIDGVGRNELPPDLAAAAFALPTGGVSDPIRTPLGWHLLKVTGISPGMQKTFDDVKAQLRSEIARDRAIEVLVDVGNKIEDTLGRGASLEEAAGDAGLPPRTFAAIDPQGRDGAGRPIPNLPPKLVEAVFTLSQGQESGLIEADGDTYVIARVDRITPPAVKPFETIRNDVQQAWVAARRTELAKQAAEGIAARVRNDGDLARIAAAEKLPVATTPALARATLEQERRVPTAVAQAMFDLQQGETFVVRGPDAYYVGRLERVAAAPAQAIERQGPQIRQRLTRSLTEEIAQQYLAALREQHTVRINPEVLEAVP